MSKKALLISLPNCYDLTGRYKFLFKGHLGGKYLFTGKDSGDRHRWVISRPEAHEYFKNKSLEFNINKYFIYDLKKGDSNGGLTSKIRSYSNILPDNLITSNVFCLFLK